MSAAAVEGPAPKGTLLELVLEEQATLTAVDRFAARHAEDPSRPAEPIYEDLIPGRLPEAGEQFAFRVDLDACTGCKACVTACHSMNGLDEGETWRRVGLLVDPAATGPTQQTVTGACHHCEDPGCLRGCPVQAYEKDPLTGIVRHLDDQCIGCSYCTLTCPYEVPQYSERLGIVRKCDMCTGRLSNGEAPACVQGCPNGAISIRVVSQGRSPSDALLPTAEPGALASASITRPTTRYVGGDGRLERPSRAGASAAPGGPLQPADRHAVRAGHAHWPLVVLLVGTQISVGVAGVALVGRALGASDSLVAAWIGLAWLAAAVGQAASLLHLGRPQYMFRAVLGLRTSWMSREALLLGAYLGALSLTGLLVLGPSVPDAWVTLAGPLGVATVLLGGLGVLAQVMIYAVTGRPLWSIRRTAFRFVGTTVWMGGAAGLGVALVVAPGSEAIGWLAACVLVAGGSKLVAEHRLRASDSASSLAALVRSARLELAPLAGRVRGRTISAIAGVALLVGACLISASGLEGAAVPIAAVVGASACAIAELVERNLFFVAESARGMPGA